MGGSLSLGSRDQELGGLGLFLFILTLYFVWKPSETQAGLHSTAPCLSFKAAGDWRPGGTPALPGEAGNAARSRSGN